MLDQKILESNLNSQVSYRDFFRALGYLKNDTVYFRTFSDKRPQDGSGKKYSVGLQFIESILQVLMQDNQNDRGIFFVVNGQGQKDDQIKEARALFIDFDDFPFAEQIGRLNTCPFEPSIVIKTKKSLHCYWLLKEGDRDINKWRELQERLIQYFESDATIKNPSRVMRLYGFEHRKAEPVLVKLLKFSPDLTYNMQPFHEFLPRLQKKKATAPSAAGTLEEIKGGDGHKAVMQQMGILLNAMGEFSTDDEIEAALWFWFSKRYTGYPDDPENHREAFHKKYVKSISKLRARRAANDDDPDFWKYALAAWKAENPGKKFDKKETPWYEVQEAGERAQEQGITFDDRIEEGWQQHKAQRPQEPTRAADDPQEDDQYSNDVRRAEIESRAIRKAFVHWREGLELPEQLNEWLLENTDFQFADTMQEFFAGYGLLDEKGNITDHGKKTLEQITERTPTPAHDPRRPHNVADYMRFEMGHDMEKYKTEIMTGFPELDRKSGGLYPGLYVIGAITSLGKTTFVGQIGDQVAAAGHDVLFFSLEQSRLELVSKSITRWLATKNGGSSITSLAIRKGVFPDPVRDAAREYMQTAGGRTSIIEGNFDCNVVYVRDYIKDYIEANPGTMPLVIVDYLQILEPPQGFRGTTKEAVDVNITELKRISRDYGITIIAISSLNRGNYTTPIDYEAFKESGSIEYSADVIWGLQLRCLNESSYQAAKGIVQQREIVKREKAATPRRLELVCLKNRYGIANYNVPFSYYPAVDRFMEPTVSSV